MVWRRRRLSWRLPAVAVTSAPSWFRFRGWSWLRVVRCARWWARRSSLGRMWV
nr:MAG TPA_asm: hypothetical protein [Caudoviricetes sp.]